MDTYKVGDGATAIGWSDREAYTVIKVGARSVTVQRDKATLQNAPNSGEPDALQVHPGGFSAHVSGTQRWAYAPNPDGVIRVFTLRKNGKWVQRGSDMASGARLVSGRHEHYDYNF